MKFIKFYFWRWQARWRRQRKESNSLLCYKRWNRACFKLWELFNSMPVNEDAVRFLERNNNRLCKYAERSIYKINTYNTTFDKLCFCWFMSKALEDWKKFIKK